MKAAVYYNNRDVRIEDFDIPQIGNNEMLIKTKACGVCVADTMEWYLAGKAPIVLGHEAAGIVYRTGAEVSKFKEGDRVFIHHHVPCMTCDHCRKGNYTLCADFKSSNYKPGGFAEYFSVSEQHINCDTLLLPDEIPFEAATLIEPLACVVHAIRRAEIKPNDRVVVIGTGTIGILFIQALKAYGVRKIMAYESIPWRRLKAEQIGGIIVQEPLKDVEAEEQRLLEVLGIGGADKVFVVAKDIRAMERGIKLAAKGGTVLLFATPSPEEYVRLYVSETFFKELSIKLSYSADHLDSAEALELIRYGKVDTKALITHRYPIEKLSEAILQTASRGESLKCIVNFD